MSSTIIESVEVRVVGPDVPRHRLAGDMQEVFETLTLTRLTSASGLVGISGVTTYSEHDFDRTLGESIRLLGPELIGRDANETAAIWSHLVARYSSMTPRPQSAIDIALWDLKAKALEQPLYRLLGAERESIPAYASTPVLDTPEAYLRYGEALCEQGYRAVKLHVPCRLEQDLAIVEAWDAHFGERLPFMIDLEERYTLEDAERLAERLSRTACVWLEAPLPDADLQGYARLRAGTAPRILAAGNTLLHPELMALAIERGAWDGLRFDVNYAGGFTRGREMVALAREHRLPLELQSWGYSLRQAANLHLMLANPNSLYFEQPVPCEPHEWGCIAPIRTRDGLVSAPAGHGLGVEMDGAQVDRNTLWHWSSDTP
ncbi:mandelate racemase/muconate lactonizing enzyme family protein [Halomonas sp. CS7]|uniref:glucarate dehydratase n=1 Tax=Halomonas pelophila TaxID=3151122 RepID=A0ABV1N1V4_9GAMM